jgi:hypothetical protein
MDIHESWRITIHHLENARKLLPMPAAPDPDGATIDRYKEWLAYNELELAFDELEAIGLVNACPPAFWQELGIAAENMGLRERANRCHARIK